MLRQLGASGLSLEDIKGGQLVIVVSSGSDAQLCAYQKNAEGVWESRFEEISAHVGRNGVSADKVEGDKKTPAGLFFLGHAFGAEEAPETALEYRRITADSYWVDDSSSKYYNQWVEGISDKDWNSAGHLADYPEQYALAVVIEYNTSDTVKGAGSAIFLHCGNGATVGCVSVSHQDMLSLLGWLKPDEKPMILIR
ncbi:MAG: L,D-transpeptidase family protein [Oscillospiraceae bacterium]|nr:L,D-transpeptidase family protein [Oscillospiraceae bacterium]